MITHSDLLTLEEYSKNRQEIRHKAMQERKKRQAHFGELYMTQFENKTTILYQLQEILLAEKIFSEEDIAEELAVYQPLVSSKNNLVGVFMIQIPDEQLRQQQLMEMSNIEDTLYLEVEGHERLKPIVNEDLERTSERAGTSAVHFIRFATEAFDFAKAMAESKVTFGVDHDKYGASYTFPQDQARLLAQDIS